MKTIGNLLVLFSLIIATIPDLQAQSNGDIFRQQIETAMNNGTYPGETCGARHEKNNSQQLSMTCTKLTDGYGTNGWGPTDGDACNRDATCDVPAVPNAGCNGGKYRIPLAITIFECASWTGENYNNNTSIGGTNNATGFIALADADLNVVLADLNRSYYRI